MKHHRPAVGDALLANYFGLLSEEARRRIADLPYGLRKMVFINAEEWLLAQARLTLPDGRRVRASELILGPGGPLLTSGQRAYLETLAGRPLGLYEVKESKPNEGFLLENLLDDSESEVWVGERWGSRILVRREVIGMRLIFVDDRWQLSACLYPFRPEEGARLKKAILDVLRNRARDVEKWYSGRENDLVAGIVIGFWLSLLTPELVDLPPEAHQDLFEQIFRDWADNAILALDNQSPREALRTRAGREKVIELLKQYESYELRRALLESRQPIDFGFLRKMVGIDGEALS
jgi:hypothetical protein